ncbi:SGNH/GDSL hydrolase family protein [Clostridium oryzae]|uniref:GDSL-like lipase/acylhydrolase n=1 Tax=Clostridium oryzae TaxID=1450648 RepID=A0A1V4ITD3_9CLOT|nr:SGNH/GDSL hydrolase family protein [Clostridium oryzae]OPJ63288.1 GDSL-like lipase/acylhydrolase [Clostridium oryzae]
MEDFNVVFLGGSITEGTGCSTYDKSYVYKVGEYIKKIYADRNVNIINSGISGTGSVFGLFRLDRDVIRYNPDLVFIEYSVNDRIYEKDIVLSTMEGIMELFSRLRKVPAVIILIAPTGEADACSETHKRAARYYGIPYIDIQKYVYDNIKLDKYTWGDIAIDNLHPNNRGHYIYSKCIIEALKNDKSLLNKKPGINSKDTNRCKFIHPSMISYREAVFHGHWREENIDMPKKIELAAVSDTVNDCLEFNFRGTYIGITTIYSRNAGTLYIAVDDDEYEMDLYKDEDGYFDTAIDIMNLKNTDHRLILGVSERRNQLSSGNRVVVGSFLVDEG